MVSRRYVHRIPFIVKINHNQFLHYPNTYDQIMFGAVQQASDLGASGIGATIYFGSDDADRELQEISHAFAEAHRLGMFTVLWCYLRNGAFTKDGVNYELSADLTGQANHLGVTIEADIIKQKQPENNGGYNAIGFGKTDPLVYDQLTTDHPIDLTRWQVVNCYAGRIGLINSGGESKGDSDLAQAVRTAVINKRAGGMGLIVGRKAFQRPMAEGAALIHSIQDVYLEQRGDHRLMGDDARPGDVRSGRGPIPAGVLRGRAGRGDLLRIDRVGCAVARRHRRRLRPAPGGRAALAGALHDQPRTWPPPPPTAQPPPTWPPPRRP